MTTEMEKIDTIRERTGVSYQKAYQALQDCQGRVIDAIIQLETEAGGFQDRASTCENQEENRYYVKGNQLVDKVKELLRRGNVTRIKIKKQEEVLLDFPVTIGVVGAVIAPYLALIGAIAALVSHATIEVERPEEEGDDTE